LYPPTLWVFFLVSVLVAVVRRAVDFVAAALTGALDKAASNTAASKWRITRYTYRILGRM